MPQTLEERRAKQKLYRCANHEKVTAQQRAWQIANKERVNARRRELYNQRKQA